MGIAPIRTYLDVLRMRNLRSLCARTKRILPMQRVHFVWQRHECKPHLLIELAPPSLIFSLVLQQ